MDIVEFDDKLKKSLEDFKTYDEAIAFLRRKLDSISAELVRLSVERTVVIRNVGKVKKKFAVPVYAKAREQEILKNIDNLVAKENESLKRLGLSFDADIVKKFLKDLMDYSKKVEEKQ